MTRNHKILAAGVVIAAGALLGSTALRAQKAPEPGGHEMRSLMIHDSSPTWLGVELNDVTSDQVRDLKLGGEYGAYVKEVEKDSPAAKAGLQAGDVILQFGGDKVRSVAELRRLVSETPAGRNIEIQVRRNGEDKTLNATVEARNEGAEPLLGKLRDEVWPRINVPVYDFSFDFGGPRLGVAVDPLTEQLGEYFGVKDGKGVLVREVNSGSAAAKAGLKAGDCITKIDSAPVESANELHRALLRKQGESREGRDVTLTTGLVDTSTIPQLMNLIQHGQLDPTVLATHRYALGDTMDAYDTFADAATVWTEATTVERQRSAASFRLNR